MMLINKEKLEKTWFATEEEIKNFFIRINAKLQITEKEKEIILKHYNNIIKKIKDAYINNDICPNCSSKLISKKTPFKHLLVCPNWKSDNSRCKGIIKNANNTMSYTLFSGWMFYLEQELKTINSKLDRTKIYKILKDLNLESPSTIFRNLKSNLDENSSFGLGWVKANKNSKFTESNFYEIIKKQHLNSKIMIQKWVCYKCKKDNYIHYCCIDCIVIDNNEIFIYEIKNNKYSIKENQLVNYTTLLEHMYPDYKINSKFLISNGNS